MMISAPSTATAPSSSSATAKASNALSKAGNGTTEPPASRAAPSTTVITATKKDFQTVATDARAALDASYKERGKAADLHTTGKEWEGVFSGMDRRSLYAIVSNVGGQFSEVEQGAASWEMDAQLEKAMGNDPYGSAPAPRSRSESAASAKAGVQFLDTASDEEKQSVRWAVNRASLQNFHSIMAAEAGEPPENLESDNPLVKVLVSALKSSRGDPARDRSEGRMDTLEGLKSQPWAKGFEAQIEQASRAVAKQGSLVDRLA